MKARLLLLVLLALFIPSAVVGQQPYAAVPDAGPKPSPAVIRLERVPDFGRGADWGSLSRTTKAAVRIETWSGCRTAGCW